MAAKKTRKEKSFKEKSFKGNAKMFCLEAEVKQRRKLKCPMCGRQTEASIDPKKVTYCSVCVGKFYESMGIKPMVDLGPLDHVVGYAVMDYGKGRLKGSL